MSASRKFVLAFVLTLAGLAGAATSASATFHFMKIREVSAGTGAPDSSYLEVQMYAPFQNFLSNGAALLTCNSNCSTTHMFSPFANVANGNSQDTVVFGDSGLASASKDFNVDLNLNSISAAGAVCYLGEPGYRDCVAWGTFTGGLDADWDLWDGRESRRPLTRAGGGDGAAPVDRSRLRHIARGERRHERQLVGLLVGDPQSAPQLLRPHRGALRSRRRRWADRVPAHLESARRAPHDQEEVQEAQAPLRPGGEEMQEAQVAKRRPA